MSDLPKRVHIQEEGPREGFQFEKGHIPTQRKIELIDRLSQTGLDHIQIVSFVNPKAVPGMADAEEVVRGITPQPRIAYTALWLNDKGFERALAVDRLEIKGSIILAASPTFLKRNQNRTPQEQLAAQHAIIQMYKQHGIAVERGGIMAAFGCNFEGDIPVQRVADLVQQLLDVASENGVALKYILLADTMAWATPQSIKRTLGVLRDKHPGVEFALHLHDTRGMGVANAFAGLEMGVTRYDSSVGRSGRLPVCGSCRSGRQRMHRGFRVHVPGNGHRDRHRSRSPHRLRAAGRRHCRSPAAGLRHAGRQPRSPACDAVSGTSIDVQTLGFDRVGPPRH